MSKDPLEPRRCAELLAALAAPERLKIVRLLADGPHTVTPLHFNLTHAAMLEKMKAWTM